MGTGWDKFPSFETLTTWWGPDYNQALAKLEPEPRQRLQMVSRYTTICPALLPKSRRAIPYGQSRRNAAVARRVQATWV